MNARSAPGPTPRVVHVITTLTTGGAERQLQLLVGAGQEPATIVCLYGSGPVGEALTAAGHRVLVLGMAGWRKAVAVPRLARLLAELAPEVVHVHLLSAQLWGIPAARLARVPVVVSTEHSLMDGTIEGRPLTRALRLLYRVLERGADRTVAVSATTAGRLRRLGVAARRIVVVDNAVDVEGLRFSEPVRSEGRSGLGIPAEDLVMVAVGRLDPVKRMDEVLQACAPLLATPGTHLLVLGTGAQQEDLRRLACSLGVAERIRFLGARDDVVRLLSAADLLLSASRDETFGMAVVEAVCNGLPVAFVQCPPLEELRPLPDGVVVAEPGAVGLAAALDRLLQGGVHRRPVPAVLEERYGVARAAAALDDLYRELLAERAHDATAGSGRPRR